MRAIDLGTLEANANQKFSWAIALKRPDGLPYDLTGCAFVCSVKKTAQPSQSLVPIACSITAPATGVVVFSYSQADSVALVADGVTPTQTTKYHVEANLAYADDNTHPSERFVWTLSVSPGGGA
jgi:hypothetical protein